MNVAYRRRKKKQDLRKRVGKPQRPVIYWFYDKSLELYLFVCMWLCVCVFFPVKCPCYIFPFLTMGPFLGSSSKKRRESSHFARSFTRFWTFPDQSNFGMGQKVGQHTHSYTRTNSHKHTLTQWRVKNKINCVIKTSKSDHKTPRKKFQLRPTAAGHTSTPTWPRGVPIWVRTWQEKPGNRRPLTSCKYM